VKVAYQAFLRTGNLKDFAKLGQFKHLVPKNADDAFVAGQLPSYLGRLSGDME
jgi:hypothetical protein